VLVVDDNDTNRLILHEQLAAWDLRPEGVESGPAALERLHEAVRAGQDYDLVLLDMCMPDMDGLDLARRISSDPALAGTRLVLLTSGPDVGAEEALEAGIAAQLTKPVRQSQLYDALMRVTAPTQREAPAPPPPSVARAPGSRGRVLVVEDNAINQMVALGILEQLGYSADVAANGLEALDALARTAYSAVLMDCQMPEMDGYTATTEIRRREGAARHTPIIAMTAAAVEVDRERCLAAGMDDYIAKPVKPDSVDAALALWAIENPGAPSLPTPPAARPTDTPTASEVVDHHRLEVLRRIGPVDGALLRSMVDAFVRELPANLTFLQDAVRDANSSAVRRRAHRLRGSAGNLGATILAALCGQLEELGHAGQLDGAPALLGELETAAERAASALRAARTPGS
jgi:CheY-like chemotaxis protein